MAGFGDESAMASLAKGLLGGSTLSFALSLSLSLSRLPPEPLRMCWCMREVADVLSDGDGRGALPWPLPWPLLPRRAEDGVLPLGGGWARRSSFHR